MTTFKIHKDNLHACPSHGLSGIGQWREVAEMADENGIVVDAILEEIETVTNEKMGTFQRIIGYIWGVDSSDHFAERKYFAALETNCDFS